MAPAADIFTSDHQSTSKNVIDNMKVYGDINQAQRTYVKDDEIPTLAEIKRQIPPHCFRPNVLLSIYYVIRDFVFISALYYGAYLTYDTSYQKLYLPFFWFFTGFLMWAVFVLGHDCGHGSFSRYKKVNSFFGHLLHSLILVPFHSWRISHRKHHKNTGNYEKDEIFYPMPESEYSGVPGIARFIYKELYFLTFLALPVYLLKGYGNSMKNGSHFSLKSELFTKEERPMVLLSLTCFSTMMAFLGLCTYCFGFINVFIYYWIPYFIYCFWLLAVTFLHHTEPGATWYNTKNWNYVRGNLESIDRVYGWLEHFHHDIGTHVVHHLFPAIPHYYLRDANAAVKPFLGQLHKVETKNPLEQLPESLRSWKSAHVIPDKTDVFVIPKA